MLIRNPFFLIQTAITMAFLAAVASVLRAHVAAIKRPLAYVAWPARKQRERR